MSDNMISFISQKLGIAEKQVKNTLQLLEQEASVPFIARYRKEATGNLDEIQIFEIRKLKKYLEELEKRKKSILSALEEQGVLTEDLKKRIEQSMDSVEVEDLYLPYKKKRKTKADHAKQAGLEPLAKIIMAQRTTNLYRQANYYITKEYPDEEKALEGATFIIAEWINENPWVRNFLRRNMEQRGHILSRVVKKKEEEESAQLYRDYFEWNEALQKCPSHRFLAMQRGEKAGFLRIKLEVDDAFVLQKIEERFIKNNYDTSKWIQKAVKDAYKRLLFPSIQTEILNKYKEKADKTAIRVFSDNLKQLLLTPPLGEKRVLAIDPAFRTGCKIAVIDERGEFVSHTTVYPHAPHHKMEEATATIKEWVKKYAIDAFSVGNGTASRETEKWIREIEFEEEIPVYLVNEAGASIYSASAVAREEFPGLDVTVRGAISIGRRLQDPLSEYVKIDPKSIGVGQYQHDVNQNMLQEELEQVVVSVVNAVGVNLNTAHASLLKYVSGIGESLARNIVEYRKQKGTFRSREDLKKVKRLGEKAFEQSAGFLRIKNADNPLDNSAVHPESYPVVQRIAQSTGVKIPDLIGNEKLLNALNPEDFIDENTGILTLKDIIAELKKPGLDIRKKIEEFHFAEKLKSIEDLKIGEVYPGIINNITDFGCFVDLGIKENGLIHISNLSDQFVSNPHEIVSLNQKIRVKVISIDKERKRIGLSLK